MNLHITNAYMQMKKRLGCIVKLMILGTLLFQQIGLFAQNDDNAPLSKKTWPPLIHKLSEIGLPPHIVQRIRRYTKRDMDSVLQGGEDFHESFAEKTDQGVFEDYVVKIMLRFVNGSIIGFIKKELVSQSNQGEYYSTQIDIPLEWCATDSLKQEHCARTDEEKAALDSVAKPQDWHQKLDPSELASEKVDNSIDLLKLLETKKGRKKLISKKLGDSLTNVLSGLSESDSLYAVQKLKLLDREGKVVLKKKRGSDVLDDSAVATLTRGLTGLDSIKAIRSFLIAEKASKSDKQFARAEKSLDTSTIASITNGKTGVDSLNAIRQYVLSELTQKKAAAKIKNIKPVVLDSAQIGAGADSLGLAKNIPAKITKGGKKKKKSDELDDATLARITNGLTGEDSVNAIRQYTIEAKKGNGSKKKKGAKTEQIILADTTTSQQPIPVIAAAKQDTATMSQGVIKNLNDSSASIKPTVINVSGSSRPKIKRERRKADDLDDSTIATVTKGLSGADSINAIRDYKVQLKRLRDHKKNKGDQPAEQVISAVTPIDTTTAQPAVPIVATPTTASKTSIQNPVATKQDSSSTVIKAPLPKVVAESTSVAKPVVPPVEDNKPRRRRVVALPPADSILKAKDSTIKTQGDTTVNKIVLPPVTAPADTSKPK